MSWVRVRFRVRVRVPVSNSLHPCRGHLLPSSSTEWMHSAANYIVDFMWQLTFVVIRQGLKCNFKVVGTVKNPWAPSGVGTGGSGGSMNWGPRVAEQQKNFRQGS